MANQKNEEIISVKIELRAFGMTMEQKRMVAQKIVALLESEEVSDFFWDTKMELENQGVETTLWKHTGTIGGKLAVKMNMNGNGEINTVSPFHPEPKEENTKDVN